MTAFIDYAAMPTSFDNLVAHHIPVLVAGLSFKQKLWPGRRYRLAPQPGWVFLASVLLARAVLLMTSALLQMVADATQLFGLVVATLAMLYIPKFLSLAVALEDLHHRLKRKR